MPKDDTAAVWQWQATTHDWKQQWQGVTHTRNGNGRGLVRFGSECEDYQGSAARKKSQPGDSCQQGGLASIGIANNPHISYHSKHQLQSHFFSRGPLCLCLPIHILYNVL